MRMTISDAMKRSLDNREIRISYMLHPNNISLSWTTDFNCLSDFKEEKQLKISSS